MHKFIIILTLSLSLSMAQDYSLSFDGVDDYVEIPNSNTFDLYDSFTIPADTEVSISVYNLHGREVVSLASGSYDAGYHSVIWNADTHSSGVYFVKMIAGSYVNTQKLMLVK